MKTKKNLMIRSIDAEKAFNNILEQFMIKALSKQEIGGNVLYLRKPIHKKPSANIILNGEKKFFC